MTTDTSFRILHIRLDLLRSEILHFSDSAQVLGGSGLAAALFTRFGNTELASADPGQAIILAAGPLTGRFPVMSKVVCAFISPYHEQYAESHAGGRLPLALARSGFDGVVFSGRSASPVVPVISSTGATFRPAEDLAGLHAGQRHSRLSQDLGGDIRTSICCTGPAAQAGVRYSAIVVDRYRHFGRLGAGRALEQKNMPAFAVLGEGKVDIPDSVEFRELRSTIRQDLADRSVMTKYRTEGTPLIIGHLNELRALPWRNLNQTFDPAGPRISGEDLMRDHLVRRTACAGCTVACIHLAQAQKGTISYEFEHMYALGSMLGISDPKAVFRLIEKVEHLGMDIISSGVCLAWATEALAKGFVTTADTLEPLDFGNAESYLSALDHLGSARNHFYTELGHGAAAAAAEYGGEDFACVLGQEAAGYATGETYYAGQALNFRHSHLDNACYAWDQEDKKPTPEFVISSLLEDERIRVGVNCMVACLFSRKYYTPEVMQRCLHSLGHHHAADNYLDLAEQVRQTRWKLKFATGYDPAAIRIPKRYLQAVNWKGQTDPERLEAIRTEYIRAIRALVQKED